MNKSDLKDGYVVDLRAGYRRVVLFDELLIYKNGSYEIASNLIEKYRDDLSHRSDSSLDVMKIYDKDMDVLWEREEVDWRSVPFGTKVRCWNDINNKFEGRFLGYDESINTYRVFVSVDRATGWEHCELVEELKEEVTYKEMMVSVHKRCREYYDKNNTCEGCIALKPNGCCDTGMIADENFNITRK